MSLHENRQRYIITPMSGGNGHQEDHLVASWRQLLLQHANIWCELDRKLHSQHGLTASAFEVLDRLADADPATLRVQELTENIHLSQSALSRLIAHMEKERLIERRACDDDRRCIFVSITPEGQERYKAARSTHREILAAFDINTPIARALTVT